MSSAKRTQVPRSEIQVLADALSKHARIQDPLPLDVDLSAEESSQVQAQLTAFANLPSPERDYIFLAFSARHLPGLNTALRALNRDTQHTALATYIQILSLLPEPGDNPYLRRFLQSPKAMGLPNMVASEFMYGVQHLQPVNTGLLYTLLITLLFWCDPSLGDDGKASVDKATRDGIATFLAQRPEAMEEDQHATIENMRLKGALEAIEHMPEGYYVQSTRDYLSGRIAGQEECFVCMEDDAELLCSQCKAVRYCGKECQLKSWKSGHKNRCWAMEE